MAAGSATIRTLVAQGIVAHAETMGQRLATRLRQLHTASPAIGEVRGRGLMIGVELIDERAEADAVGAYPADGTFARTVQRECLQRGLIVELGGRHGATVRFLPPLVIGETEIDLVAELFGDAVSAAHKQCR
ncbi:Diaminobutyrate--2-oxoglutarate aminotransferase [compost metagenome]